MKIILKQDIKGLGYKNDVVTVKPGYGRNFLIPKKKALIANNSNLKMVEENVRQAKHKSEKDKSDAELLASKLKDLTVVIGTKAGESGKIFGAVTTTQICDALKNNGFEIDKRKISIDNIKFVGDYKANIELHREVQLELSINVVAE